MFLVHRSFHEKLRCVEKELLEIQSTLNDALDRNTGDEFDWVGQHRQRSLSL
jgi:hypothetical protein